MLPKRPKSLVQPPGTFEYIVQDNDTLRSLAAKYDTNLSLLKRINKMMSDVIFPDQVLYIPNAEYEILHKSADQMASKPGHAQRIGPSTKDGFVAPPHALSDNEVEKIEEECHHKFIKIPASYITNCNDEVTGVLLITPDGVIFDPDISNPIVKEKGAEEFQMVDSIMSIISITIYHDEKILGQTETSKNTVMKDLENLKSQVVEEPLASGANVESVVPILKEALIDLDSSPIETDSTKIDGTERNNASLKKNDDQPKVYLKLKVHKNIHSLKTFKVDSKTRSISRLDHWFLIPLDSKVDQLYAFFKRWSPSMANATDSDDVNFVRVESGSAVSEVIDDRGDFCGAVSKRSQIFMKDWEIVSIREYRRLLAVVEVKKLPLPDLSEPSRILEESQIATLACNLPAMMEGSSWILVYSTENHGFSLNTLFRKLVKLDSAVFLIIRDTCECVFGAMIVGQIKLSDHFQGCGESYLFTFYPEFKRFNWTGINDYFVKGNIDSLVVGASEGNNGLWLDAELCHGRTQACQTFDNELLASSEDFVVKCLEIWSFK